MIILWMVLIVCSLGLLFFLFDILRFRRASKLSENPDKIGTAAGGLLYIQGNKTYYRMPRGAIRKIADFRMDLRPGSPDMARFTSVLNQAAEEHAQEVAEAKIKADEAMYAVAKEAVK